METYNQIKKFLDEGGRCLLIENGKPIGVVLTMEEYELLWESQISNLKSKKEGVEIEKKSEPIVKESINSNPIGEAVVNEIEFPGVSADLDEINLADAESVTLEDLGLDPDIQLPADF